MCTLIIDFQPGEAWPLLLAGNRDEMRDRPWLAPARHWPDRPEIRAGLDELADGTWFGAADHGLVASVTNRPGTLGPEAQRRSRGELVLEALEHTTAQEAAEALSHLNPTAYRGFNLIVGDPKQVYWICHPSDDDERILVQEIPPGLHMIDAGDLDDLQSPRIKRYLSRFQALQRPDIGHADNPWQDWQRLLASKEPQQVGVFDKEAARAALNVDYQWYREEGKLSRFGTVCSQIVAVPKHPGFEAKVLFLFAAGDPASNEFNQVSA